MTEGLRQAILRQLGEADIYRAEHAVDAGAETGPGQSGTGQTGPSQCLSKPPSHRRRASLLAAALGAVLAEALITLSAVFLDPPVSSARRLPSSVSDCSLPAWPGASGGNADAAIFLLLAIATAGTGPFGALGMFAAMMADTRRPSEASAGEGAAGETAGEISKRLHDSIVAGRELSGRSSGLASFRDILAFGSFQDKQAALAIITRRFTPPLAPALRMALNDPDAAIRVQAATAAARIEDLFLAGLTRIRRARGRASR